MKREPDPRSATTIASVPSSNASRTLFAALTSPVALLNGLTWRWIGYLFVAAALFTLIDAQWWLLQQQGKDVQGMMHGSLAELWPMWFERRLLTFALQLLALVIADNLRVRRLPKAAVLTLALFLGSVVAAVPYVIAESDPTPSALFLDLLSLALTGFTLSGVFVLAYFAYRHDVAVAEALQRAELNRVELRKKTLESSLQVMQARVEPEFLFNTLRGVGNLYESDHEAAERMLVKLIVYLRAALPQMRSTQSTLGREMQLAQAYLEIERIRLGDRLHVDFVLPEELASSTFPPMVLLPLIEALALQDAATAHERRLRVEARLDSAGLAIDLNCTGVPWSGCDEIERLRGRLLALFGAASQLDVVRCAPLRLSATLRVPGLSTIAGVESDETLVKTVAPSVPY
jgi:Histidine kinase